jgi:hypothetical protein
MRRSVEVAKRARELVDDLRKEGIDEQSILLGFAIALQVAPITKAVEDNPHIGSIAKRLAPLFKEGLDLAREIREIARVRSKARAD